MRIYHLIPEGAYKKLAQKHNLNGLWRMIFCANQSVLDYQVLTQESENVRQAFVDLQFQMLQDIRKNLIGTLPIIFIRDKTSSSRASFLRWRNVENVKSGQQIWENIVSDPNYPKDIKQSLLTIEKERIAINMQISILSYIIRQSNACKEKLNHIEQLEKQFLS